MDELNEKKKDEERKRKKYVDNNIDLLTSFKNKSEVLQCFQLQKLENTKIINGGRIFKLFVLVKDAVVYFCVLHEQ
jgi:hypothetical protein